MEIVLAIILIVVAAVVFAALKSYNAREKARVDAYNADESHWSKKRYKPLPAWAAAILLALGVALLFPSFLYAQDAGEVVVLKNWGGSLAGHTEDAGFHLKAPWQSTVKYDVRNNVISFMGEQEDEWFEGGSANGSAVTINDAGGASATIDVQVNYSLDSSVAESLYADYGSQENFVKAICAVDARSVPREVSGRFDTISILTNRGEFTSAVQDALAEKWKGYGLNIEQVSVQNVVYPEAITTKYAEAQSAEIAKATAENNKEVAEVEAQTKVVAAQGEAEANRVLSESLTPEVIQQHYIDALTQIGADGNLVVVPEGSTPIVGQG